MHKHLPTAVWGPAHADDCSICALGQLRQKFEPDPSQPAVILTEAGAGCRLPMDGVGRPGLSRPWRSGIGLGRTLPMPLRRYAPQRDRAEFLGEFQSVGLRAAVDGIWSRIRKIYVRCRPLTAAGNDRMGVAGFRSKVKSTF